MNLKEQIKSLLGLYITGAHAVNYLVQKKEYRRARSRTNGVCTSRFKSKNNHRYTYMVSGAGCRGGDVRTSQVLCKRQDGRLASDTQGHQVSFVEVTPSYNTRSLLAAAYSVFANEEPRT